MIPTGPDRAVEERALLLSLLCLLVPVAVSAAAPELLLEYEGALVWLLALIPAFLLSHVRGWKGATVALAGGMVALALGDALLRLRGTTPPFETTLWAVSAILLVGLGAGVSSTIHIRSRAKAEKEALTDPGTGLPNRRQALLALERAFEAARRGRELAVVVFDLDQFKRINDRYGHATGDDVLKAFADVLAKRTRGMNLSARIGGEEFLTIIEDAGPDGAVRFAEDVRWSFHEVEFSFGRVTASAGVAVFEPGMASPDVLLAAADQALYAAKQEGRDRVALAGQSERPAVVTGGEQEEDLASTGQGELLLVVDDDSTTRRSVSKALRRLGFEVLEAGDPERALQIVKGLEHPPDLLITDVIMPEMSGFQLASRLLSSNPGLRILYMSGYLKEETDWAGAPGRVTAFIQKPASREELGGAARRLIDRAHIPEPPPEADASPGAQEETESADAEPTRVAAFAARPNLLPRLEVRLRHLGLQPTWSGTPDAAPPSEEPSLVVAWLDEPLGEGVEALEELRDRWNGEVRVPALILAPRLPVELTGRWPEAFPTLFLHEDAGLGELELHAEHLRQLTRHALAQSTEQDRLKAQAEARRAEMESTQGDLLIRLARAAELRDDLTGHHAERVGRLAGALARELGMSTEEVAVVEAAAPLHDLGKIAIPDALLNKPGPLTATEREMMQHHTEIGARLLSGSRHEVIRVAERIARSHHERWDGDGYPEGLTGEEIPRAARIVAVADVFDCVTHARPYREANTPERGLAIVTEDGGAHFDPEIVRALNALARRGELEVDPDRRPVAEPDESPIPISKIRSLLEDYR